MRYAKYVDDHVFLREIRAAALAEGEARGEARGGARGEAKGKAAGKVEIITDLLGEKFGPLPKWARVRVEKAEAPVRERWTKKVLTAETLDEVVGKR
jgi:hypothetical protein